ncbi:MAG TPA: ABC transporter permease [Terriglobales bacterium]|jgi:macrolide transport system ATP-binding/permease protein|nr:ABC transporter permease [Terriglobales bacterium]
MPIEQWFYSLPVRLRSFLHPNQVDQELKEELREHLDQQIQESVAKGTSPEEARYAALRTLGGITQVEQQCRDARGGHVIENLLQDLRYGFRQLVRSPGFSALAILCLTLGIGANTAVFSWIEGILFRPYPAVAHQERLLALAGTARGETGPTPLSWPDFLDLQRSCTLCDAFFVSKITGSTLNVGDRAEVTTGSIVSANYFDAIGVHPILGRGFELGEDAGSNGHPVVVISYQLWRDRFKSDSQIIGKMQRLDNVPHTIIGVAPEGFYGTFVGWAMRFWVPASMEETFEGGGYKLEDRGQRWIESYVRLKPGVTREQAQGEISAIATRLESTYPATNRRRNITLWPLWQTPFNNAGTLLPTLEIMLAVVAFVLLIACANVGNLLLVRSFARRREMTVRLAIGASRARLLQQLFTEGLILATIGAACGLLVAYWCRHALVLLLPARSGVPMYLPGEIDWRVMSLSAAICLIATLIVGLVPALQTRNLDLVGALKAESTGVVSARGTAWVRSSLVVFQVCLSFVLLVGAALLLQSLEKIRTTSPGFSTTNVVQTGVSLVAAGYDAPRAKIFQQELIDRVRALPGVQSAAFARVTPLGYRSYSSTPIAVDGYQPPPEEQPTVEYNQVSPDYFATLGIPLRSGREFISADDQNAPPVAIVNQTMVARYWAGQNPIDHRLQVNGRWVRVIGVAADSKYQSMRETAKPFFYVPLLQDFSIAPALNIRTTQPLESVSSAVLREVHALDRNLALYEVITLQEQVNRSTSPQLVAVTLVSILGGLALLLAAIGLYGVMSYAVAQANRELGLRLALGAGAANLFRLVISRGLRLTAAGVLFGAAAGLVLTRLFGKLLYNVSPNDPLAFALAIVVMTIISVAACLLPAWRATRTDPARVLRE